MKNFFEKFFAVGSFLVEVILRDRGFSSEWKELSYSYPHLPSVLFEMVFQQAHHKAELIKIINVSSLANAIGDDHFQRAFGFHQ